MASARHAYTRAAKPEEVGSEEGWSEGCEREDEGGEEEEEEEMECRVAKKRGRFIAQSHMLAVSNLQWLSALVNRHLTVRI